MIPPKWRRRSFSIRGSAGADRRSGPSRRGAEAVAFRRPARPALRGRDAVRRPRGVGDVAGRNGGRLRTLSRQPVPQRQRVANRVGDDDGHHPSPDRNPDTDCNPDPDPDCNVGGEVAEPAEPAGPVTTKRQEGRPLPARLALGSTDRLWRFADLAPAPQIRHEPRGFARVVAAAAAGSSGQRWRG
jgi:hypothetical protein